MKPPLIVPDTGILVAVGLGGALDDKAGLAGQAISRARASGCRVVAPPSVALELDRKLQDLDAVYSTIQGLVSTLRESQESPTLERVERLILELRANSKGPATRVVNLIESELFRTMDASPGLGLNTALAAVAGNALVMEEVIRFRSHPSEVDFIAEPEPDPSPLAVPIPEVNGMDLAHIRACEWLGEGEDCTVIFLVFERPVHGRKDEIRKQFPKVLVTTPHYLSAYLEQPGSEQA